MGTSRRCSWIAPSIPPGQERLQFFDPIVGARPHQDEVLGPGGHVVIVGDIAWRFRTTPPSALPESGSRSARSHQPSSTRLRWAISSGVPQPFQASASRAHTSRVIRWPSPPIKNGKRTHRAGSELSQPAADAMDGNLHLANPIGVAGHGKPVGVVVLLQPARAQAEHHPAPGCVVHRAGHVGQQIGVAESGAGDQRDRFGPAW